MKYCLRYTNISTKLDKADEISILYIEDKGLVDFMKKFNSQRIILRIDAPNFKDTEVRKLIAIKNTYPDYRFAVAMNTYNADLGETFREAGIDFFENLPCTNWETFNYLIKEGVSDINISGPLAFELENVHRALISVRLAIQVRVTPNRCYKLNEHTDSLISFFIRPEDAYLYEEYIDVFDFGGVEHQDTFYSIYAEQKSFLGNLNQCIYNFGDLQVDNKGLISLFGERRINCGQQCLKSGYCRRCYDLAFIAKEQGERVRKQIMETIKKEQEKLE